MSCFLNVKQNPTKLYIERSIFIYLSYFVIVHSFFFFYVQILGVYNHADADSDKQTGRDLFLEYLMFFCDKISTGNADKNIC